MITLIVKAKRGYTAFSRKKLILCFYSHVPLPQNLLIKTFKFDISRTLSNQGILASHINLDTLALSPKISIQGNTATASNMKLDLNI